MTTLIIESALRGALFAAAVGAGLSLLRVQHVPARKAAWTLVLVASMAMPLMLRWPLLAGLRGRHAWALPIRMSGAVAAPAAPVTASFTTLSTPVESAPVRADASRPGRSVTAPSGETPGLPAALPATSAPEMSASAPARRFAWPPVRQTAIWIYLVVAGALLLRLLFGLAAALRLWTIAQPVSPLFAPDGNVRASSRIVSPVTVGSGIVLPADYAQWERSRLRMVLAHERSHVRQMDFWLQLLAGIYAAAVWFSPLGWWLRRKLAHLSETISDRAGMEAAQSGSEYAQVVLDFASLPRRRVPGVAMASAGNLSRRIDALLNESRFRNAFTQGRRRALASLLLIPAALFAVTALIRVPVAAAQTAAAIPPAQIPGAGLSAQTAPVQTPESPQAPGTRLRSGQAFPGQGPNAGQVTSIGAPPPAPQPLLDRPALNTALPVPPAPAATGPTTTLQAAQTPMPPLPPLASPLVDEGHGASAPPGVTVIQRDRASNGSDFDFHTGPNGDAWAVASGAWSEANLRNGMYAPYQAEIERAHRMAHGPFLWFRHDGKSYVVTDPAVVDRIEKLYRAAGGLRDDRQVQAELARAEAETSSINLTREMADLNAQLAKMKSEQSQWSGESAAEMRAALARLQAEQSQWSAESMARVQAQLKTAEAELSPERMAAIQSEVQQQLAEARLSPQTLAHIQQAVQDSLVRAQLSPEKIAQIQKEVQDAMTKAQLSSAQMAQIQERVKAAQNWWTPQREAEMQRGIADAERSLQDAQSRLNARQLQTLRLLTEQRGIQREADREVEQIIRQSLQNGKAQPVQ